MDTKETKTQVSKQEQKTDQLKKKELKNFKVIVRSKASQAAIALSKAGYTIFVPSHSKDCLEDSTFLIVNSEEKHACLLPVFSQFDKCPYREINAETFFKRFSNVNTFTPGDKVLVATSVMGEPIFVVDIFTKEIIVPTQNHDGKLTLSAGYITTSGIHLNVIPFEKDLAGKTLSREELVNKYNFFVK